MRAIIHRPLSVVVTLTLLTSWFGCSSDHGNNGATGGAIALGTGGSSALAGSAGTVVTGGVRRRRGGTGWLQSAEQHGSRWQRRRWQRRRWYAD